MSVVSEIVKALVAPVVIIAAIVVAGVALNNNTHSFKECLEQKSAECRQQHPECSMFCSGHAAEECR